MTEGDNVEKLNKYRTLKIAQISLCFTLFSLVLILICLGPNHKGEVPEWVIPKLTDLFRTSFTILYHVRYILLGLFLLTAVLTAIAIILVHRGNKNGNTGQLEAFIVFVCMTYSLFDYCAGGFAVVRERITELEQRPLTDFETLNNYRALKIAQAAVLLPYFCIGLIYICLVHEDYTIYAHIFTWLFLLNAVFAAIAAILLHFGNKNGNKGQLEAVIVFVCLTYSMFDKCGGGFSVVRKRITELEQGPLKDFEQGI